MYGIGRSIAGIAVLGAASYGLIKGAQALHERDERNHDELVAARGGSDEERMERIGRGSHLDNAQRAAILVHAFDRDGDSRVGEDEWVLQAGSDALYGNRLFGAARYLAPDAPATVGVAEMEALLAQFSEGKDGTTESGEALLGNSVRYQEGYEAFRATERPLFENHEGRMWARPLEVAAAQVMSRYDADGSGTVDVEDEATYRGETFTGDAAAFLEAADADSSGDVTTVEATRQLRALDTHHADYWGIGGWDSKPGSNGVLDAGDFEVGRLDQL